MKIRRQLIQRYLDYLLFSRGMEAQDRRPIKLNEYERDVYDMKAHALADGNLDWLKLSIGSLLSNPKGKGRIISFSSSIYPYNEEELIELLVYAFDLIWPGDLKSQLAQGTHLDFVNMTEEEWLETLRPTKIF